MREPSNMDTRAVSVPVIAVAADGRATPNALSTIVGQQTTRSIYAVA
jgi:hypothetical protein